MKKLIKRTYTKLSFIHCNSNELNILNLTSGGGVSLWPLLI